MDRIEYHVEQSGENVGKGRQELVKAQEYQSKARKVQLYRVCLRNVDNLTIIYSKIKSINNLSLIFFSLFATPCEDSPSVSYLLLQADGLTGYAIFLSEPCEPRLKLPAMNVHKLESLVSFVIDSIHLCLLPLR